MKRWFVLPVFVLTGACSGAGTSALDQPSPAPEQTGGQDAASVDDDVTSAAPDAGVDAASDDVVDAARDALACEGFAPPETPAACHACSGEGCQANGCFGGYFCDTSTTHCVPRPDGC